MSWNNALPFWVYEAHHEHFLAECNCCFYDEWFSGSSKVLPKHIQYVIHQHKLHSVGTQEKVFKELYKV